MRFARRMRSTIAQRGAWPPASRDGADVTRPTASVARTRLRRRTKSLYSMISHLDALKAAFSDPSRMPAAVGVCCGPPARPRALLLLSVLPSAHAHREQEAPPRVRRSSARPRCHRARPTPPCPLRCAAGRARVCAQISAGTSALTCCTVVCPVSVPAPLHAPHMTLGGPPRSAPMVQHCAAPRHNSAACGVGKRRQYPRSSAGQCQHARSATAAASAAPPSHAARPAARGGGCVHPVLQNGGCGYSQRFAAAESAWGRGGGRGRGGEGGGDCG